MYTASNSTADFYLRTSTPTISLKILWHMNYINKSWYQKFKFKIPAIYVLLSASFFEN